MVLCNRPTLSIGTERLACLNSPLVCSWGLSASMQVVPGSSPGPDGRAFFSTFPSFLLFLHLPHQPRKSVRVIVHAAAPISERKCLKWVIFVTQSMILGTNICINSRFGGWHFTKFTKLVNWDLYRFKSFGLSIRNLHSYSKFTT